jgi:hypothetical protein
MFEFLSILFVVLIVGLAVRLWDHRHRFTGGRVALCMGLLTANVLLASEQTPDQAIPPATARAATASENSTTDSSENASSLDLQSSLDGVVIPPGRPWWVDTEPSDIQGVWTVAVTSGPQDSREEAARSLEREIRAAVDRYVDNYFAPEFGNRFDASRHVELSLGELRARLIRPEHQYQEVLQFSFGPMHQSHALLEFGADFRRELDTRLGQLREYWRQAQLASRLAGGGLVFSVVLGLLAVVFGYFRLDTVTRGYYTRRLQFAAAMMILSLLVAGALLARQVPWM